MLWLVFCKRNYLKNCTTTRTPTNYLQLLPCHPQIYKWSKEIKVINKISHHRIAERPSIKKRLLSFFRFRLLLLSVREKSTVGNAVICPGEISLGIAFAQLGTQSTFASLQKKKIGRKNYLQTRSFFLYAIMLVIRYYWMMKFCLFSKHAKNKHSADTQFSQKPCKIFLLYIEYVTMQCVTSKSYTYDDY